MKLETKKARVYLNEFETDLLFESPIGKVFIDGPNKGYIEINEGGLTQLMFQLNELQNKLQQVGVNRFGW